MRNRTSYMRLASCLAVLAVMAAGADRRRPGDFRVIGPGGGGAQYHGTVSPHDVNTVLVACDMSGAYISHDGGSSWRMFNLRGPVHFFVFDPVAFRTIYAQAIGGLWRSTDNGESWKLVWPKPSSITGVQMSSDHAGNPRDQQIVSSGNPLGVIVALAIDPANSRVLLAAAQNGPDYALYLSRDYGGSWDKETALPIAAGAAGSPAGNFLAPRRIWIGIDPRSPKDRRDCYVAGVHGVMARRDGKWREQAAPAGITFNDISGGFPRTGEPIIYATSITAGGARGSRPAGPAYVSRNGGTSWDACALPGGNAHFQAVAASLQHPEAAYLSYNGLRLDGKAWRGAARTSDAGRTWTLVWKAGANEEPPNVHDAWISTLIHPGWGGAAHTLGVADQDPNLCYATDLGMTWRTTDGGANWAGVYSKRVPGGDWVSNGLDVTTNYGFHFDPFDSRRRFITYTDIGLFRTENGGRSWTRSVTGVPQAWTNTTYWVEFDPQVRNLMWGVMSRRHDLPRPGTESVLSYQGGVCRSEDGGRTWKVSNAGMPETAPTHILLDPASPVDHRVLYVAANGRGVYKSTDGGFTWTARNQGITQSNPLAWRLARAADGTLYVILARSSLDGSIGNSGDGAIYRSANGAESWEPVALPTGVNGPNGLAIDPLDSHRLYLAAWGRAAGMHGEGGGIFVSADGGRNWRNVLDRDQHVYDVTIDPRNPEVLYAAGFEASAWRSTDRGENWIRIPGFNFTWGHRVIPDPEDPLKVYITTFGGSVWHGAVNGANRLLDIATPQLEPGK